MSVGESSGRVPSLHKELQGTKTMLRMGEIIFPREEYRLVNQYLIVSFEHIYIQISLYILSRLHS